MPQHVRFSADGRAIGQVRTGNLGGGQPRFAVSLILPDGRSRQVVVVSTVQSQPADPVEGAEDWCDDAVHALRALAAIAEAAESFVDWLDSEEAHEFRGCEEIVIELLTQAGPAGPIFDRAALVIDAVEGDRLQGTITVGAGLSRTASARPTDSAEMKLEGGERGAGGALAQALRFVRDRSDEIRDALTALSDPGVP